MTVELIFDENFSIDNASLNNFNVETYPTGTGIGTIAYWNATSGGGHSISGGRLVSATTSSSLVLHDHGGDRARLAGRCHHIRFKRKQTSSPASFWFGLGRTTSPQWFLGQTGIQTGQYMHNASADLRDRGEFPDNVSRYQYKAFCDTAEWIDLGILERGPAGAMCFARVDDGDWVLISLENTSNSVGTVMAHNQTCADLEGIYRLTTANTSFAPTPLVQHSFNSTIGPSDGAGQAETGGSGVSATEVGDLTITNNKLQMNSDGDGLVIWDVGTDDWIMDVAMEVYDGSPCGIVHRFIDASNYLYSIYDSDADESRLIEVVTGTPNTLLTTPFNPGSTDTLNLGDGDSVRLTGRSRGGTFLTNTMFPGSLHDTHLESTTTRFGSSTKCGVFISKGAGVNSSTASNAVVFAGVQNDFPLPVVEEEESVVLQKLTLDTSISICLRTGV